MSKRRQEKGQGTGNRLQKQKHLYLVLDDWAKGFSIHKIDATNPHLGEPPVLRLVAPVPCCPMNFAALGSNILTVSNRAPRDPRLRHGDGGAGHRPLPPGSVTRRR